MPSAKQHAVPTDRLMVPKVACPRYLAALVVVALSGAAVVPGHAEPLKCKREIAKASQKFMTLKVRALGRCDDDVARGKIAGPCPDDRAAVKIQRAVAGLSATIDRRCGGIDRRCGTGTDDDSMGSIGWDVGTCPNIGGESCNGPMGSCANVGTCVACGGQKAATHISKLVHEQFVSSPGTDLRRCQRELGKGSEALAAAETRILHRCEDAILNGRIAGPCPDARAAAQMARVQGRFATRVCRRCGGLSGVCGGGDDMTPTAIGFATACPDVQAPGGPECGGAIANLQDLVECVTCVATANIACLARLSAPAAGGYPSECNAQPAATPTNPGPTTTAPTPSPTPTSIAATATVTGPAAPTATATPILTCNNGILDAGEICDLPALGCSSGQLCIGCLECAGPPPTCSDGVLDPGELCELPGVGCAAGELCSGCHQCVPPPPTCNNLTIDPGEVCELPGQGCGLGEVCLGCTECVAPPIECNDGILDLGEACELPGEGCAADEICLACLQCVPSPVTCGNGTIGSGEACELPADGCSAGQVCLGCLQCLDLPTTCGNGTIEPGESCELVSDGCGAGELCLGCLQCVGVSATCGNGVVEPGETCDLPGVGCNAGQLCLACESCVP